MPEILEMGRLPATPVYRVRCGKCGTLMRVKQSETRSPADQRDRGYLVVACPMQGCGHDVHFDAQRALDAESQAVREADRIKRQQAPAPVTPPAPGKKA